MKYLITGITGFVGPHLAKLLLNKNHEIYGLYRQDPLPDFKNTIHFIKGDLTNKEDIDKIFNSHQFDGVFHLAGLTHIPTAFQFPIEAFQINTFGTINICEAIQKFQPKCKLLFCSTGAVYGNKTFGFSIKESFPINPSNPYEISKAAAEQYVRYLTSHNKIQGCIVRPFSHTGPGRGHQFAISSDARQIAKIIQNLQPPIIKVGNLNAQRTIVDVRDIVKAYYMIMEKMEQNQIINGDIFNIGGETVYTIGECLNKMLNMYQLKNVEIKISSLLLRSIESPLIIPNCTKIKGFINWNPEININITLKDLVEYWLNKI